MKKLYCRLYSTYALLSTAMAENELQNNLPHNLPALETYCMSNTCKDSFRAFIGLFIPDECSLLWNFRQLFMCIQFANSEHPCAVRREEL